MLVAHLSDLHIRDARDVAALERQLDRVASRPVDHLALTGDLLDRWNPPLLARVRDTLLDRSLLDPQRLTIVHGNHDLASSGGYSKARRDLWRLVLRSWDPPAVVAWRRRRFYDALASGGADTDGAPPFIKTLQSGARIAAIDTVPARWLPLRLTRRGVVLLHGVGCVRTRDAEWLGGQKGDLPLVVLMHHYPLEVVPFHWERNVEVRMDIPPVERAAFWDAAERAGTRLILCGHVHRARLEYHRGIAVGLNGQSGADWAGRTVVFYRIAGDAVDAETI